MAWKRCAHCYETRPLDEFHLNHAQADGHRVICKVCANAYAREHYRENKARYAEHFGRWAKDHPKAGAARGQAHRAIRRGDLIPQPCEVCGDPKAVAHHDNYDKPLEVRWLCRSHHKQHHARLAEADSKPLAAG